MPNQNERRAIALLAQEIGRDVRAWPGWKQVASQMESLPALPSIDAQNDAGYLMAEEVRSEWGSLCPDGYFVEPKSGNVFGGWNERCHHLCLVEVETTSPMTEEKVRRMGLVWDAFWCSSAWELHMVVWDRYDQWRELDMLKFYERNFSLPTPSKLE